MKIYLIQLCVICALLSCDEEKKEVVGKTQFENAISEIGLEEKFDYDIIGGLDVPMGSDYKIITICEIPHLDGLKLRDFVHSTLVADSSVGYWSLHKDGFSFKTPINLAKNGLFYRLDYSLNTGVLVLKESQL